ncbi:CobW family GTP-binding protein [Sutcliffiella rhizosphaerae]|uniref:Metal chaperone YciC n=1 Tax=Sutcliffiella rhizosphaerae TaxID=2880967 RepID=A0ABM8YR49_9BACI|nr:GTP-binding protein [Sutcliffiella rhizosphaerae]CAG9622414.1 Putative metal chaperone YciC [Sutcliffiella rhizosphaerae]
MTKKVPVYVISGFLGSGKTTVLLNMLEHFKQQKKIPGIILNELGDENVEDHLFKGEKIVELLNGCICCTIQEDLKTTLDQYIGQEIDVLIIEGTGVANPLEIKEVLLTPAYMQHFELQSMISLVDASHYLEYQSFFSSSKEIRGLLKEQVTSAHLLVLNKMDLISEKELIKVESKLADQLEDHVPVYRTSFGAVPLEILLEKRMHVVEVEEEGAGEIHHDGEHHHHHHHIEAVKINMIEPINTVVLESELKKLSKQVIRSKGIVLLEETPGLYEFQYAASTLVLNKIEDSENKEYKPSIILIGKEIDEKKVAKFREALK